MTAAQETMKGFNMKSVFFKSTIIALSAAFMLPAVGHYTAIDTGNIAQAEWQGERNKDRDKYRKDNHRKKDKYNRKGKKRYEYRNGHKLMVVAPRRRQVGRVIVVRPHGHVYWGYGHYHSDNDAWKWLAFTAITLKLLDNLNEQAQREHEAAQVRASSAKVGEKINWTTGESQGYVVTTKEGTNSSGKTCREFQQSVTIGGKTEEAYGTACLQADGSWEMVP